MIDAQTWIGQEYPNKEKIEEIRLEEEVTITGELQVIDFPNLKKINVGGKWGKWGGLTGLVVKNCPNLEQLDCGYNDIKGITIVNCPKFHDLGYLGNQVEELARFDGSKLDYNVVSYIGSLDSDLYQQLREKLPGKKHEGWQRLCFGCLTEGGHNNNSSYNYHAEIELTKGGTLEYGVTATGNQRETCEVPEEGGLLIIDINSTESGVIKIKKREVKDTKGTSKEEEKREGQFLSDSFFKEKEFEIKDLKSQIGSLEKQVGEVGKSLVRVEVELNKKQEQMSRLNDEIENFQNEKRKLEETIQKLEDELRQASDEQLKKQLREGKDDLERKLVKVQDKLESSEKRQKELVEEVEGLQKNLEKSSNNNLQKKLKAKQKEIDELVKENSKLKTDLLLANSNVSQIKSEEDGARELVNKSLGFDLELERKNKERKELESRLAIETDEEEIKRLRELLDEKNEEVKKLKEEAVRLGEKFTIHFRGILKRIEECNEELKKKKNDYLKRLDEMERDSEVPLVGGFVTFGLSEIKKALGGRSSYDENVGRLEKILETQREITKFGSSSASARKERKLKKVERFVEELNELCEVQEKLTKLEVELESSKKITSLFNISQDKLALAEIGSSTSNSESDLEHVIEVPSKNFNLQS